jgi:glycosyltransferase involved in cell wall biosynthesis
MKLLMAKILEIHPIKLVDVSPGPMLFNELNESRAFAHRISLDGGAYFERLDCFVSKHEEGMPPVSVRETRVIPNGVPMPSPGVVPHSLPDGFDTLFSLGTSCRIAPAKKLEVLIDVMDILTERIPSVNLTIIGGVDPRHQEYASRISEKIRRAGLSNIWFAGPHTNVSPYLKVFKAFVMLSDDQGCPNASLEAMAHGLPVVANASGGTCEQVDEGVTGFLVNDLNPYAIADRLEYLLKNRGIARRIGAAARKHVAAEFGMKRMVDAYQEAFLGRR